MLNELLLGAEDHLIVMFYLEIKSPDGVLQLLKPIEEFGALLDENFFSTLRVVAVLHQCDVLGERLNLHSGAAHALDKAHPSARLLVEISNTILLTRDIRQQPDSLIITDGIGGHTELLADFANSH